MSQPQKTYNEIPLTTSLYPGQTWGWDGIDQCEVAIQKKSDAGIENGWSPAGKSWMDIFLICFLLIGCLIVAWSKHLLQSQCKGGKHLIVKNLFVGLACGY